MEYDPVKDRLGALVASRPWAQRVFFSVLGAVFLRNWYVRRALREVMAAFPDGEPVRVLDAGTGFGQYAFWIARNFPNTTVLAVDVKEAYLERARAFINSQGLSDRVSFAVADLTDQDLKALDETGPFDVILSVDVMEHIEDDRAVFRNFARVLTDRGAVLVNTPSDLGGSGVTDDHEEGFIGEHVRDGYPLEELTSKLHEAGLDTEATTYTYGKWGGIGWRLLVKYPMQLLGKSFAFAAILPFYYVPVFPTGMALNALDVAGHNEIGTGLLVRARKSHRAG